jgi:hypothetical protein
MGGCLVPGHVAIACMSERSSRLCLCLAGGSMGRGVPLPGEEHHEQQGLHAARASETGAQRGGRQEAQSNRSSSLRLSFTGHHPPGDPPPHTRAGMTSPIPPGVIPHSHAPGRTHAKAAQVLKPLLNQLSSSITGQFRRIERDHENLKTKLDQSVSAMHARVWKMKSKEKQDDLSNWHTKEDLRNYLTAMSLLGSSKNGGGRTFGKEKHSFFGGALSHFKDTLDAARAKKRQEYSKKLLKAGLKEESKKGQYLWQVMNGKAGKEGGIEGEKSKETVGTAGNHEEKESTGNNGSSSSSSSHPPSSSPSADPDLTLDDESALQKLAREDDLELARQAGWNIGAAASGAGGKDVEHVSEEQEEQDRLRDQLLKLSASISPSATARMHPSLVLLRSTHVASGSSHVGVSTLDRKLGVAISLPKVYRKSSEELQEEEEERQAQQAAERLRREEEEKKRKMDEEREVKRSKEREREEQHSRGGARPSHGNPRESVHSATSRRGSVVMQGAKAGSVVGSLAPSPHGSRRASIVASSGTNPAGGLKSLLQAAGANRKTLGGFQAAAMQERISSATSSVSDSSRVNRTSSSTAHYSTGSTVDTGIIGGISEEDFALEATRVMGLVLANSAALLQASSTAAQRGVQEEEEERAEREEQRYRLQLRPAGGRGESRQSSLRSPRPDTAPLSSSRRPHNPSSSSSTAAALEPPTSSARRRLADPTYNLQDEIERWNARTPRTERSETDGKGILALAAEKLGVASVDAIGANGASKGPSAKDQAASHLAYLHSFDLRSDAAALDHVLSHPSSSTRVGTAAARAQAREDAVPEYSGLSPRAKEYRKKQRQTGFGTRETSEKTNVSSVQHQIDFKLKTPRKDIVPLSPVNDPKEIFATVADGKLGSTLMSFEQLHAANQQLASEQKRRASAAAEAAAMQQREAHVVAEKRKKSEGKDADDMLRDHLAHKSRTREWSTRSGAPLGRTLVSSSSVGHLRRKAGEEIVEAEAERARRLNSPGKGAIEAPGGAPEKDAAEAKAQEELLAAGVSSMHLRSPSAGDEFDAPTTTLQPSASLTSFLSKSGRDYVHLSSALIVPKWTDVTRVIDYATLVPGYVPPPPVVVEAFKPTVTIVESQDEDGFPQHTITTIGEGGVTTVQLVKGRAPQSRPMTPLSPASPAPLISQPSFSTPHSMGSPSPHKDGAGGGAPAGGDATDRPSDAMLRAKAERKALDEKLMAQIDPDEFTTPSARKKELKRLRYENSIPPPTHQGPSVFQEQAYAAIKSSYAKYIDNTVDVAVQKRGAIGAQHIEQVSGRRQLVRDSPDRIRREAAMY